MPKVTSSLCPDCGTGLSMGVCPACALGFLSSPDGVPIVAAKEPNGTLIEMQFDRYILKRKLASGGMGVVYQAEDSKLRRMVALKMIRGSSFANSSERSRFMIEAEAAAALDHRSIVPIYEIGVVEDQPFFTMKLIDGQSFAAHLNDSEGRRLEPEKIVSWLLPIAQAVQHAHQRGVLHRDLKPANILIDGQDRPWLMDFGLAKLAHQDNGLTKTTDHLGTPNYMPPEVIDGGAGEVSTASDIWALGVILWEALCGALPFAGGGTVEIMRRIGNEEPARPEGAFDRDLLTLAQRCMEKDPARRVASAGALAEELERWQRGEPLQVRRVTSAERLVKWVRRKPALAALFVTFAIGSISTLFMWQRAEGAVGRLTETNDQLGQALSISSATQLAVEARIQVHENPELGLLLAVESVEKTQREGMGVLPEAADALFATLQTVGGRDVSPDSVDKGLLSDEYISRGLTHEFPSQFSPDGRTMVNLDYINGYKDGVVATAYDLMNEGAEPIIWQICPHVGWAHVFRWLPDSDSLLALDDYGYAVLWEGIRSGNPVATTIGDFSLPGKRIWRIYLDEFDSQDESIVRVIYGDSLNFSVGEFSVAVGGERVLGPINERSIGGCGSRTNPKDACRLSPDGRWMLVSSRGGLKLVDLRSSDLHRVLLPTSANIIDPVFSPGGEWMAYGADHGWHLFDLRSGQMETVASSWREVSRVETHYAVPKFSPDGKKLAVGVRDRVVEVIDTEPDSYGRTVSERVLVPGGRQFGLGFSPDSKWLAVGSTDRLVTVWPVDRLDDAPVPLVLSGLSLPVLDVAFSGDGHHLLGIAMHGVLRLWKFDGDSSGAVAELLPGGRRAVYEVVVSPDKRWIASGCIGAVLPESGEEGLGTVKLTEIESGREWVIAAHGKRTSGVAFSPDGRWFGSGGDDGLVRVWDLEELASALVGDRAVPAPQWEFDTGHRRVGFVRQLAFHPRGNLYCTSGDGYLFEWDLNAPDPYGSFIEHPFHTIEYLFPDVKISPDGKIMAVARHGWDQVPKEGTTQRMNMVLLYDVSEPGLPVIRAELKAAFLDWTNLAFSPDSRWLASGSAGVGATVWDLHAGDIAASRRSSQAGSHRLSAVSFSPDGRLLALGGRNGTEGRIHLWNWRGKGRQWTIKTEHSIESLDWLDETRLVSGGGLGRVGIWETDIYRLIEIAKKVAGRGFSDLEKVRFHISQE